MTKSNSESLQLRVPHDLKRQLAVDAAVEGTTIRSIVLSALVSAGYDISEDEVQDKRKRR